MNASHRVRVRVEIFENIINSLKSIDNQIYESICHYEHSFNRSSDHIDNYVMKLEDHKAMIKNDIEETIASEDQDEENLSQLYAELDKINNYLHKLYDIKKKATSYYNDCKYHSDQVKSFLDNEKSQAISKILQKSVLVSEFLQLIHKDISEASQQSIEQINRKFENHMDVPISSILPFNDEITIWENKYLDNDEHIHWHKKLENDEVFAFNVYKRSAYNINQYLRCDGQKSSYMENTYINPLEKAISKSKLIKGTKLYRGIHGINRYMEEIWDLVYEYKRNKVDILDRGFISTSLNPQVALEGAFSNEIDKGPLILVLNVESENVQGAFIEKVISDNPFNESEVILQRSTKIRYNKAEILRSEDDSRGVRVLYGTITESEK